MGAKKKGKGSADRGRGHRQEDEDERNRKREEEEVQVEGGTGMKLKPSEQTEEYKMLCKRRSKLQVTEDLLLEHEVVVQGLVRKAREDLVWGQYMKCDGLPDPGCVRQLNTYLSLWKEGGLQDKEQEDLNCVLKRTAEVLPIMSALESIIEHPEEWEEEEEGSSQVKEDDDGQETKRKPKSSKLVEREKIFYEMKQLQLAKLNHATYNLLLDVSPMVDPENNVLQNFISSDLVSLGLWGNVVAKNMRVKGTHFEDLGFGFELPRDLIGNIFAVRVMRVEYDHYSKMCKSNKIPPRAAKDIPSYYEQVEQRIRKIESDVARKREERRALREAFQEQQRAMEEADRERQRLHMLERKNKKKGGMMAGTGGGKGTQLSEAEEQLAEKTQRLQRQQQELLRQEKKMLGEKGKDDDDDHDDHEVDGGGCGGGGEDDDQQQQRLDRKDKDPQQAAKELVQERLDLYKIDIEENELNLRRNIILGGVLYFDMLEIPPQPKKVGNWVICQLETPQTLKMVPWHADYKPPLPPDESTVTKKTPEEIEREIKLQEMELQKLVLVHLKLPSSSLWFEPPTIVRWEAKKRYWSTDGFYDIKFDEGKQTLSFRTISFGIFALSAFRFSNLPLQSWELTPLEDNKCLLVLSAAAVQAEFQIGEGVVTLVKFASGNKPAVTDIADRPMLPKALVAALRAQGVDIFPDHDSHCYIEGLPLKDIQTERHLYRCMALTANALGFAWSRWNLLSGYDKLIMQFREKVPGHREGPQQVVLITPHKTSVLECTEASQTFSDAPVEGFEHFYDLYLMAGEKSSTEVKEQLGKAKAVFVNTVFQFLSYAKVLSYA